MAHIFRKTYTVTDNATDRYDRLKPSMVLFYAQDAATSHCAELGLDWDSMAAKGMFWAVTRTRVEIHRLPRHGEEITVETWPMKTTRVAFPRAMAMYDREGNLLLRTVSLWVLMDMEKRTMILPGKSGVDVDGRDLGTELKPPAGIPPREGDCRTCRAVAYTDLDVNGHLNNARYLDWVEDLSDSGFHGARRLREMTVVYLSEAREGQVLELDRIWNAEEQTLQTEFRRQGDRVFAAKMVYDIM
ncbi:MAG: hypothetical protein IKC09_02195 [Oscillospiraceae bacterium]|nr:hypothetical protein [Oscillospiraceae bacterium]